MRSFNHQSIYESLDIREVKTAATTTGLDTAGDSEGVMDVSSRKISSDVLIMLR